MKPPTSLHSISPEFQGQNPRPQPTIIVYILGGRMPLNCVAETMKLSITKKKKVLFDPKQILGEEGSRVSTWRVCSSEEPSGVFPPQSGFCNPLGRRGPARPRWESILQECSQVLKPSTASSSCSSRRQVRTTLGHHSPFPVGRVHFHRDSEVQVHLRLKSLIPRFSHCFVTYQ